MTPRRHTDPLWWVTTVSAILAALGVAAFLVGWVTTGQWRYGALALALVPTFTAHVVARTRARRDGEPTRWVWAIAAAEVVFAIALPLLVIDAWLISLLLLFALPIQAALAHPGRHLTGILGTTLVAASAVVAAELARVSGRLQVLSDRPVLANAILVGLAVVDGVFLVVLWRVRFRPSSPHHRPLDLASQLTFVVTTIAAVAMFVVSAVLVEQLRRDRTHEIEENFAILADSNAEQVGNLLETQIQTMQELGRWDRCAAGIARRGQRRVRVGRSCRRVVGRAGSDVAAVRGEQRLRPRLPQQPGVGGAEQLPVVGAAPHRPALDRPPRRPRCVPGDASPALRVRRRAMVGGRLERRAGRHVPR